MSPRRNPNLYEICLTIAWATSYAVQELNETHPMWSDYFTCSEWFRHRICSRLGLPLDTKWEEIYRRVGCLVEEEYPNKKDFQKAYEFGNSTFLSDRLAPEMFEEFEEIKYQIVQRL